MNMEAGKRAHEISYSHIGYRPPSYVETDQISATASVVEAGRLDIPWHGDVNQFLKKKVMLVNFNDPKLHVPISASMVLMRK